MIRIMRMIANDYSVPDIFLCALRVLTHNSHTKPRKWYQKNYLKLRNRSKKSVGVFQGHSWASNFD